MSAMGGIFSRGERWNVPFNEAKPSWMEHIPSFTEWKYSFHCTHTFIICIFCVNRSHAKSTRGINTWGINPSRGLRVTCTPTIICSPRIYVHTKPWQFRLLGNSLLIKEEEKTKKTNRFFVRMPYRNDKYNLIFFSLFHWRTKEHLQKI